MDKYIVNDDIYYDDDGTSLCVHKCIHPGHFEIFSHWYNSRTTQDQLIIEQHASKILLMWLNINFLFSLDKQKISRELSHSD